MSDTCDDGERQFHEALRAVIRSCKNDLDYTPGDLVAMMTEYGPIGAAHVLLQARDPSKAYGYLASVGRLDLAVESLALQDEFRHFFSLDELATARARTMVAP